MIEKFTCKPIFGYTDLHFPENELTNSEKGELRKLVILYWIYRFRYSVLTVLYDLLNDPALLAGEDEKKIKSSMAQIRALVQRMVKAGLLRKFPLVTGFSTHGYVLTQFGFLYLEQILEDETLSNRVFKETSTLSASNFIHDICIQQTIALSISREKGKIQCLNEHEIRALSDGKDKNFDAVIYFEDMDVTIGLEVEISQKSNARMLTALKSCYRYVKNKKIDKVFFLTPTKGRLSAIKDVLKNMSPDEIESFVLKVEPKLNLLIKGNRNV